MILFCPSLCFAEGPIYSHKEPEKQLEFENVYKDLRKKLTQADLTSTVSPGSTNYIQNIATLQSGATGYPDYLYVGSSASIPSLTVATQLTKTGSFTVDNTSFTFTKRGGVYNSSTKVWEVTSANEVLQPTQPDFLAYNSTTDSNVTGDNTTITVDFDTEVFDTGSDFGSDTFTAPVSGHYLFNVDVTIRDTAVGNKCEIVLVTSNRSYVQEAWPTSNIHLNLAVLADMDASDTASVSLNCSGGALVVDVLGDGGSTLGSGYPTFFSGTLIN